MCEDRRDRTQNYDRKKITKNISYTIHPFPATSFIIATCAMCRLQTAGYSIAINTTNYTERQQFSAVTDYKIWIFF